jgi:hypothetical protein
MDFPTQEQVLEASVEKLAYWYRFLLAAGPEQQKIIDEINERFKSLGGMTKELSEKIGHGGVPDRQKPHQRR